MTVVQLMKGQSGRIESIEGDARLKKRLMALGALEGTRISVTGRAPLGDPLVVKIRGFEMAIRKKDADNIKIVPEDKYENSTSRES